MILDKLAAPSAAPGEPAECTPGELRRMAYRLLELAETCEAPGRATPAPVTAPRFDDRVLMQAADTVYRARRRRDRFFDGALVGEPAWDMLLDLFAHAARGETVSTTSLCIASQVPPSTALRWIAALEQGGLVERHADAVDKRFQLVQLTPKGFKAMRAWLSELLRA